MNPLIPCGVALIRRGREFLIAQRQPNDSFGHLWEFPGGKKNPGETFEECVVREIKEETGLGIKVERKFMEVKREYNDKIFWLNFFLCSWAEGDPKPLECQDVRWVDVEKLGEYHFPPANELVIANLIKECGG